MHNTPLNQQINHTPLSTHTITEPETANAMRLLELHCNSFTHPPSLRRVILRFLLLPSRLPLRLRLIPELDRLLLRRPLLHILVAVPVVLLRRILIHFLNPRLAHWLHSHGGEFILVHKLLLCILDRWGRSRYTAPINIGVIPLRVAKLLLLP